MHRSPVLPLWTSLSLFPSLNSPLHRIWASFSFCYSMGWLCSFFGSLVDMQRCAFRWRGGIKESSAAWQWQKSADTRSTTRDCLMWMSGNVCVRACCHFGLPKNNSMKLHGKHPLGLLIPPVEMTWQLPCFQSKTTRTMNFTSSQPSVWNCTNQYFCITNGSVEYV